jgi:4-hydroxythreonine-4-phosphate dehydrogenase
LKKRSEKRVDNPVVAVTTGDPTGIGPEIVIKALADERIWRCCTPLVFGDIGVMREWGNRLSLGVEIEEWKEGALRRGRRVWVVPVSALPRKVLRPGRPSAVSGEASYRYIKEAAEFVLNGKAGALCTGPINKRFVQLAGHAYPGHTEMLAEWSRTKDFRMMLVGGNLRVVLVTIHVPLARVARLLTEEAIFKTVSITEGSLKNLFGIARPRIAVAAFNPHGGEGGSFGDEEIKAIKPAVERSKRRGILVEGPLPGDSLFVNVDRWRYDAAVCMYHDQGLIPVKLVDFDGGVNLTLGLPIVRTSVDHGTANDIAGKGVASHTSMVAAILLGADLARRKRGIDR